MNIIKSIRVWRNNIDELRSLDCLEFVIVSQDRNRRMDITVRFKDEATDGSPIARTGDWLVQYKTGKWQRFGNNVYQSLSFNPVQKRPQLYFLTLAEWFT